MTNPLKALAALCLIAFTSSAHAAAPKKDWNFLVFLNGVNNLDTFGAMNINQMEQVGSTDRINVLVQWGSYDRPSVDRLLVRKDDDLRKVTSPVVQSLGPVDMGDYRQLVEFAKWADENYPAERTFISVWNHGSGWRFVSSGVGLKDISFDDRTGNHITTEELGQAMRDIAAVTGKKVDIYGSDACLMGMVEIADEMSEAVDVYIGSQDLEPGEGWPYNTFLAKWAANPSLDARGVVKLLSSDYLAAYDGGIYGKRDVTMSAFDLARLGDYRRAASRLSRDLAALPAATLSSLRGAAEKAKSFFNADYIDMIDFMNKGGVDDLAPASAAALREAHSKFVIANDQNQDRSTWGLSIWLPTTAPEYDLYAARYAKSTFHLNTGWGFFLKAMHGR